MTELPKTTFTPKELWLASKAAFRAENDPWPALLIFFQGVMHNLSHLSGDEDRIIKSLHTLPHALQLQHKHMFQSQSHYMGKVNSPWPT